MFRCRAVTAGCHYQQSDKITPVSVMSFQPPQLPHHHWYSSRITSPQSYLFVIIILQCRNEKVNFNVVGE